MNIHKNIKMEEVNEGKLLITVMTKNEQIPAGRNAKKLLQLEGAYDENRA